MKTSNMIQFTTEIAFGDLAKSQSEIFHSNPFFIRAVGKES